MKLIRSKLAPLASYPFPTRYVEETNEVQVSYDGETTWEAFPEGDPRLNNHTPPPDTADPRCDAAARIRAGTQAEADALIDQVDAGATILPIVSGFLRLFTPLFTIIPYLGLAYTLIQAILSIGSTALHAAFDSFDWDDFECMIFNHLGANGQLSDAGFAALLADIADTYSDATETLLYNFYYLAGRAGLNDQAGIRTETGDCSSCPDTWTVVLRPSSGFWTHPVIAYSSCAGAQQWPPRGYLNIDTVNDRWLTVFSGTTRLMRIGFDVMLPDGTELDDITFNWVQTVGGNLDGATKWKVLGWAGGTDAQCYTTFYTGWNVFGAGYSGAGLLSCWTSVYMGDTINVRLDDITINGHGPNPFL